VPDKNQGPHFRFRHCVSSKYENESETPVSQTAIRYFSVCVVSKPTAGVAVEKTKRKLFQVQANTEKVELSITLTVSSTLRHSTKTLLLACQLLIRYSANTVEDRRGMPPGGSGTVRRFSTHAGNS
jgi:hypothetical protein